MIDAAVMDHTFESLTSLRTLELRMAFDIDELLPRLTAAPALRLLILDLSVDLIESFPQYLLPSMSVLAELLAALPALHCMLLMADHKSVRRADYIDLVRANVRAHASLAECSWSRAQQNNRQKWLDWLMPAEKS